ncbi:MAG: hypothetical protein IJK31_08915 [Ruminococcus sp.]|nr:hypothetical protein [Ruminococcus sp.]
MTKHMRFIVSVLFIIVIILAVALTRFYSNTSKSAGSGNTKSDISRLLATDGSGNRIFEDNNGLYGLVDSSERIIAAPEWLELSFAGNNRCIASKRISGKLMTGCVDYEGNVVVPLIYRDITPHNYGDFSFYTAESSSDNSCVLYDSDMKPLFSRSWNSCSITGDQMVLTGDKGTYTYALSSSGFALSSAKISGTMLECGYNMEMSNKLLLQRLDPDMLEEMVRIAGKYLEYAFTGSGEYISDIRSGSRSVFSVLFPDDKRILSKKLTDITKIYIYSAKSDDDIPHFAASVTVKTELAYSDDSDKAPKTLTGEYKAVIEFSGSSVNELTTISGEFLQSHPDYPSAEPEKNSDSTEKTASGNNSGQEQNTERITI